MALNFEKYAHEGNSFLKTLANNLGHPGETGRTCQKNSRSCSRKLYIVEP